MVKTPCWYLVLSHGWKENEATNFSIPQPSAIFLFTSSYRIIGMHTGIPELYYNFRAIFQKWKYCKHTVVLWCLTANNIPRAPQYLSPKKPLANVQYFWQWALNFNDFSLRASTEQLRVTLWAWRSIKSFIAFHDNHYLGIYQIWFLLA
jgi:hypothetical protein